MKMLSKLNRISGRAISIRNSEIRTTGAGSINFNGIASGTSYSNFNSGAF
jgi:hypothetical protein